MYRIIKKRNTVRIPPEKLGGSLDDVVKKLTRQSFEGKMDKRKNLTVVATNVERVGDGRIIHSDGGVYQDVLYDALVYKPDLQEIVGGFVCEIVEFGAFIRLGPLDALLHISQIMDDHMDVDLGNSRIIGKETKHDLKIGDKVRARIVTVSLNEQNPRESKIGLTMRQPGLGKLEWLDEERGIVRKKPKAKPKDEEEKDSVDKDTAVAVSEKEAAKAYDEFVSSTKKEKAEKEKVEAEEEEEEDEDVEEIELVSEVGESLDNGGEE